MQVNYKNNVLPYNKFGLNKILRFLLWLYLIVYDLLSPTTPQNKRIISISSTTDTSVLFHSFSKLKYQIAFYKDYVWNRDKLIYLSSAFGSIRVNWRQTVCYEDDNLLSKL